MSDFKAKMHQIPPAPLAGYKGPTSKGSEGMRMGGRRKGRDRGGEGIGKGGEGIGLPPLPCPLTLSCPLMQNS